MKERLSSLDLLTAKFRHKNTAPSFAILSIAFILCLSTKSYAEWKYNPFTNRQDYYETGGSGDITSVGDGLSGAVFDGSATGGTWIKFYDAQGIGQLGIADLSGAHTWTLPNHDATLDNITTSTTTNLTGFLKGNGSVVSTDNSTYLTSAITSLNGLTGTSQTFTIGTTGTAPTWSSTGTAHTLNIPMASTASVTAGLLSKTDYDNFASKQAALGYTPAYQWTITGDAGADLIGNAAETWTIIGGTASGHSTAESSNTLTINQTKASTTVNGYLWTTDFNTFNDKMAGTLLGDLATTAPITGAVNDIFPGATGDKATIGITVLKDIVAGVGLSGGEDNVLPGADADTTLTVDTTELDALTWDAGSLTNFTWTFDLSGTDVAVNWTSAKMDVTGTVNATTLTEGTNAVYNSTETPGGILGGTWASPTIDANAVTWDNVGDAAADATIAMGANETDFTSTIDAAGEAVLTITNTDADATNNNTLLTLSHNDGADVNVFYLSTIADADGSPLTTYYLAQNATVGAISMALGATGVIFSDDADGALTITGNSAGADESLTLNFDDTADAVVLSTGSSVAKIDFGAIDVEVDAATDIVAGTTSLGETTSATDSGAYLIGANDEFGLSASTTVQGVLNDLDAAIVKVDKDTKCIYWENPVATDDFKSIWYTPQAATITQIWAESDQTVTFMLQVDDGSAADVDSVDLAPAAGVASDTSLDGDATMAAGDRLDMAVTSVANTPTWCSVCFTYTLDD